MNGHAIGLTGDTTIADWLQLIRTEYEEVPGLRLTKPQVQDVWALAPWVCDALLHALVDAGVLTRTSEGAYVSRVGGSGEGRRSVRNAHRFAALDPTGPSDGREPPLCTGDDDAPPKSENWPHRSQWNAASRLAPVHLSGRPQIGHGTDSNRASRSGRKQTSGETG